MVTQLLRGRPPEDVVREAAWVARCVGRKETAPLSEADLSALATYLSRRKVERGGVLFAAGHVPEGVWIIRGGTVELSVGAGRRRQVVQLLHSGDVDGDVQLILGMPFPYTARASSDAQALFLESASFDRLLAEHPMVARRWISRVATRLVRSQARILGLLGRSLTGQVARLLTEEALDGRIQLPQRTLAAMLGVHRPSLNKVLKDLEREGLVRVGYSELEILDAEGLVRLAS
ncbi:MAG TPA: Crp/Fnr family transcriptional regulator [Actinomycetota bacterium]|nr:Crp/Fnr family transcriptional regulator [Actinomycetota bacterium]